MQIKRRNLRERERIRIKLNKLLKNIDEFNVEKQSFFMHVIKVKFLLYKKSCLAENDFVLSQQ